jgi:hypothetical protein
MVNFHNYKNKNLVYDHPMNISAKLGSNLFCGFRKKRWKCEIPIGSNVKLSQVMAAILNFRFIYKIFIFGADRKSNMTARAHNVFWLVEILKIFLLETTKPIELWLCRNDHWEV